MGRANTFGLLVGAVASVVLAVPASAAATSLVYLDGGNVWTALVDGSHKQAFTTDGTPTTPTGESGNIGPYFSVTADDTGRVLAAREFRSGSDTSAFWHWFDASGKEAAIPQIVHMQDGGECTIYSGPSGARLDPSGTWVAFWFLCSTFSFETFPVLQVTTSGPSVEGPDWNGYFSPGWYGKRVTASNERDVGIQPDSPNAPMVVTEGFPAWMAGFGTTNILHIEPARGGGEAIVTEIDSTGATADQLKFVTYRGAPQLGDTVEGCTIPTESNANTSVGSESWSADGQWVAWTDAGGVKTARVPANVATPGACQMTPTVISATGSSPQLTPHDWYTGASGETGGSGGAGASPTPVMSHVTLGSKAFDRKKGTKLRVSLSEAATVEAAVTKKVAGHKVKGHCNVHAKHGARCTVAQKLASVKFAATAGSNTFAMKLPHVAPGTYTLSIVAVGANGKTSASDTLTITLRASKK